MIPSGARNFPDDFTTTANTLKRYVIITYSSVSIHSPERNGLESLSVSEKKEKMCNVKESLCWRIRKIFLDMSSRCVTNIWEWSFGTNLCCGRTRAQTPSWHRKKEIFTIWILASRVNKIEDKVSWYRVTFQTPGDGTKNDERRKQEPGSQKIGEIKYFHYRNFLFCSISTLGVISLLAKSIS